MNIDAGISQNAMVQTVAALLIYAITGRDLTSFALAFSHENVFQEIERPLDAAERSIVDDVADVVWITLAPAYQRISNLSTCHLGQ